MAACTGGVCNCTQSRASPPPLPTSGATHFARSSASASSGSSMIGLSPVSAASHARRQSTARSGAARPAAMPSNGCLAVRAQQSATASQNAASRSAAVQTLWSSSSRRSACPAGGSMTARRSRRPSSTVASRQWATPSPGVPGRNTGTRWPAATCSRASLAATLHASTESPGRCHAGQSPGRAANARTADRIGTTLAGTTAGTTRLRACALAGRTVGSSAGSPRGRPTAAAASAGSSAPHRAMWPSDGTRPPGQKVACNLPGSTSVDTRRPPPWIARASIANGGGVSRSAPSGRSVAAEHGQTDGPARPDPPSRGGTLVRDIPSHRPGAACVTKQEVQRGTTHTRATEAGRIAAREAYRQGRADAIEEVRGLLGGLD